MKIAVASGKGGTGKSTVSVNLAYLLSNQNNNTVLVDCDVEEPNCHLFLNSKFKHSEKVYVSTPKIDKDKCTSCGKCAKICEFNALAFIKNNVVIFDELCHGCGNCKLNCPSLAITDSQREVGTIEADLESNLKHIQGKTRIGEAMSPPLIKAVKDFADRKGFKIQIIDSPPGTSCPVINTVYGVDYVILVTEPTPFGFHDLKLAVDVIKMLNIPFGIAINKSNENDIIIEKWALKEKIRILTKIPDDINIAKAYSKGEVIVKKLPEFEKYFIPLLDLIKEVSND